MEQSATTTTEVQAPGRAKFIFGGLLIVAAIIYLIISSTQASAQYFLTIEELMAKGDSVADRQLRVSGAVIGDSIQYDPQTMTLTFTIAHLPGDNKEIEAQAIVTGRMGADGVFQAEELLLKCPTKYEEAVPEQAGN
ncbi:MAG TPA: cytochrome c maturation protein CcmE [Anaerolineales bacterium]|nr:cytochrome c maturation protein CcmE [Anaerolineales bacterium]